MKILFLLNIPAPYRIDFFDALSESCDLTVLFERTKAANRNDHWLSRRSSRYQTVFLSGINAGEENAFCPGVIPHLKKNRYDLIVIGGYATPTAMLAILWMKLRKIPYILNADGGYTKPDNKIKRAVKGFFIGGADAWICSSETTKAYFVSYGADGKRVFVYPFASLTASDIKAAVPAKREKDHAKKSLGITEDKAVLSVGQFIPRKGLDILLKSWLYMPENYGLYIVGDEPTDAYIYIRETLGLKHVHFVGFIEKDVLARYYTAADLFVLPTREDIWGLVIGEAMAYGLPVITTDRCVAGLTLVDDTNGLLVKSEDSDAVHDGIKKILSDEKDLKRLSQASLEKIKPYTIESMAKRHAEIFDQLIEK